MITQNDDGMCRTHDDALALLRYAAIGADVHVSTVREPGTTRANSATRRYEVRLPGLSGGVVSQGDVYCLPVRADDLARRVREVADHALKARRARLGVDVVESRL